MADTNVSNPEQVNTREPGDSTEMGVIVGATGTGSATVGESGSRYYMKMKYQEKQFLRAADFIDEQEYHVQKMMDHNRHLHVHGISDGLEVEKSAYEGCVTVSPGSAIDIKGRQMKLELPETIDLATACVSSAGVYHSPVDLYIRYGQANATEARYKQEEGVFSGTTRWVEKPEFYIRPVWPLGDAGDHSRTVTDQAVNVDGDLLLLARIERSADGKIPDRGVNTNPWGRRTATVKMDLDLQEGMIQNGHLAAGAVTAEKIKDGAVTEGKIGTDAVATGNIKNLAVTEAKLSANAVTTSKINDGAVTEGKIGADAVATGSIKNLAVTEAKLGANAVTTNKINDLAVTEAKISANAVTASKIQNLAVTEAKIGANAVTTGKINDRAVSGQKIALRTITKDNLTTSTLSSYQLGFASVNNGAIQSRAVTEYKIADGAVTERKIADGAVTRSKIAYRAIGTENVALKAIDFAKIKYEVKDHGTFTLDSTVLTLGNSSYSYKDPIVSKTVEQIIPLDCIYYPSFVAVWTNVSGVAVRNTTEYKSWLNSIVWYERLEWVSATQQRRIVTIYNTMYGNISLAIHAVQWYLA